MKDTTKKEITKEELKKEIEDTLNFYEMTGSYIEGAKRHDYKHYNKLSKENIVRELSTFFDSQIDRIRGDSYQKGRVDEQALQLKLQGGTPSEIRKSTLKEFIDYVFDNNFEHYVKYFGCENDTDRESMLRAVKDYLKSKSGGKE